MDGGSDDPDFNPYRKQKREPKITNYSAAAVAERMKVNSNTAAPKFTRNAISSRTLPQKSKNIAVKSASQNQILFTDADATFPAAAWSTAEKERNNLLKKKDAKKIVPKERRTSKSRPPPESINDKANKLLYKTANQSSNDTSSQQVDIQHYVLELKKLFGTVCKDAEERYFLLKERDDLMYKARVHNLGTVIKGTMKEMCSEKERYARLMSKAASTYEKTPDEFVKDYARSAADQELPLPHELRPIETLVLTTDYLMTEIIHQMPDSSLDLVKWYEFIWSRTRAIRKEITQQRLVSLEVVDIIEKCIRFHIFARYKLAPLEAATSNPKMNLENLSKCLQSLRHCYEDLMKKEIYCANEPEFRAYDILLNIEDSGVVSQVKHYREQVKQHLLVQNALSIACAFHCDDFRFIFKLVAAESTTFLQACICHCSFAIIREKILMNVASVAKSPVELHSLISILHFDNENECLEFLQSHNCEVKMSAGNGIMLEIRHVRSNCVFGFTDKHSPIVNHKLKTSISKVICGTLLKKVLPPKVYNSFDENDRYVNDPIVLKFIKESTGEQFSLAVEPTNKDFFTKKDVASNSNVFGGNKLLEGFAKKPIPISFSNLLPPSTTIAPKASFTFEKPFGQSQNSVFGSKPSLTSPITFKNNESINEDEKKKEAQEAENRRIAKEMEEKKRQAEELEKQKLLAEEMKRKQREAKIKQEKQLKIIKENIIEKIIKKVIGRNVKNAVVTAAEKEITKFKRVIKERQKIAKKLAHNLVADVIFRTFLPIANEVHEEIQQKWNRLAEISQNLQQNRLQIRILRYVNHWKLYTRWKKERYAIETFKDALKNANDDALKGFILPSSFIPRERLRTEMDNFRSTIMTIKRWKAERLAKKYFALWRKNTPIKKAYRLWREDFVRLPPPKTELMMRDHMNMKRPRRSLPLFRKRIKMEEPTALDLAVEAKRFRLSYSDFIIPQSTPVSTKNPRFPSITLSPIIRRVM